MRDGDGVKAESGVDPKPGEDGGTADADGAGALGTDAEAVEVDAKPEDGADAEADADTDAKAGAEDEAEPDSGAEAAEPPKRYRSELEFDAPTPPWEDPGKPRNAIIGGLVVLALLGVVALVGWVLFRPSGEEGPSGAVGEPNGPCEIRTVDEAPGGAGIPATEGVAPRSTVVVTTNLGPITVLLFGDLAPCGVASFTNLARTGFYNSAACPSMASSPTEPTLVLRCGTPAKEGGPGYRVRGEHPFSNTAVVDALALVNDDSGRSGAEFAFVRGQSVPTNSMTVIGQVIDGFTVLDSITARAGTAAFQGPPPLPVTVLAVTVAPGTVLNPSGMPTGVPGSGLPGLPGTSGLPGLPGLPGGTPTPGATGTTSPSPTKAARGAD